MFPYVQQQKGGALIKAWTRGQRIRMVGAALVHIVKGPGTRTVCGINIDGYNEPFYRDAGGEQVSCKLCLKRTKSRG
jgi:hypothetical protein